MVVPIFTALGLLPERSQPYTGEQTAADHDMYGINSPTESKPAPQLSQGELGIADRLNWDLDYNTKSSYTPTEYIAPWDVEGWGSGDVKTTPPTRLQTAQEQIDSQPLLPQRPGFRPGQRDYEYMPTEKEQRRERAANIATIARERGTRWQDTPLPGGRPAPEPTYGRWQDAKLPGGDEVRIQPVPDRDEVRIQPIPDRDEVRIQPIPIPDDEVAWTGGSRDFDERTGTYRPGHRGIDNDFTLADLNAGRTPGRRRAFDPRSTGRGVNTSATQKINRKPFLQLYGDEGTTRGTNLPPTRYDQREHSLRDYNRGGEVERMYDEMRTPRSSTSNDNQWVMKDFGTVRDPRTGRESIIRGEHWWHRDDLDAWNRDRRN